MSKLRNPRVGGFRHGPGRERASQGILPHQLRARPRIRPRQVFDNLVKAKFDPDAKLTRLQGGPLLALDVEGAGHKGVEFYFTAKVEFPKGAHLECKPTEAADGAKTVAPGCSASTYYSTTIQNQMIKDKQYIEPGKVVDFKDETRFDQTSDGWKGQDGKIY